MTGSHDDPGPFDLTHEIGASIAAKGNEVDRALPRDPAAAEQLARDEYALYLEAERQQGRRLHKGHALHNLGIILLWGAQAEEARTYFHAAHAEDARSIDPDDSRPWGWLARQTLLELFGEGRSVVEKLAEMARSSTEDPLDLARRFEAANAPFANYRGVRPSWRDEASLDGYAAAQLVFCAGSHSLPHHLKAIADGVRAAGLEPLIVLEFVNAAGYDDASKVEQARLDYEKSERLLGRCGLVVIDMSDPHGQSVELQIAKAAKQPMFVGFSSLDPLDEMHGSSMYLGAAVAAGATRRPFRSTDELRDEVQGWCAAQGRPVGALPPRRPVAPLHLQGSNLVIGRGSAVPSQMATPVDFEVHEAVPSGSYIVPDPPPMVQDDGEDRLDEDRDL